MMVLLNYSDCTVVYSFDDKSQEDFSSVASVNWHLLRPSSELPCRDKETVLMRAITYVIWRLEQLFRN